MLSCRAPVVWDFPAGLAELFSMTTNACNALSVLGFTSLAIGSLWWSVNHLCTRLWLGWFLVGCTLAIGGLGETWEAQGSKDHTAWWLLKSLNFQGGGERPESQVERVMEHCRNGWGTFNLGVCFGPLLVGLALLLHQP